MFGLYEVVKCLTVKDGDSSEQSIVNYAWREAGEVNFLALVASTGNLRGVVLSFSVDRHPKMFARFLMNYAFV